MSGRRADASNARARGDNPRARGDNPRAVEVAGRRERNLAGVRAAREAIRKARDMLHVFDN